jgi:hypothetical protein
MQLVELFLTGYDIGGPSLKKLAIPCSLHEGPLAEVAAIARKHGIAILLPCTLLVFVPDALKLIAI